MTIADGSDVRTHDVVPNGDAAGDSGAAPLDTLLTQLAAVREQTNTVLTHELTKLNESDKAPIDKRRKLADGAAAADGNDDDEDDAADDEDDAEE